MQDPLQKYPFYVKACELHELVWDDFLTIACGSARETRGWYHRSRRLLAPTLIAERIRIVDEIVSMLVTTINTLKRKGEA